MRKQRGPHITVVTSISGAFSPSPKGRLPDPAFSLQLAVQFFGGRSVSAPGVIEEASGVHGDNMKVIIGRWVLSLGSSERDLCVINDLVH